MFLEKVKHTESILSAQQFWEKHSHRKNFLRTIKHNQIKIKIDMGRVYYTWFRSENALRTG